MTRADMDRDDSKKPGELKKELSEMVGRVMDEQTRCRIEGFKMAMRIHEAEYTYEGALAADAYDEMKYQASKRWGAAFDA